MLKHKFLEEVKGLKANQIKAIVVVIKRPWGAIEITTKTGRNTEGDKLL